MELDAPLNMKLSMRDLATAGSTSPPPMESVVPLYAVASIKAFVVAATATATDLWVPIQYGAPGSAMFSRSDLEEFLVRELADQRLGLGEDAGNLVDGLGGHEDFSNAGDRLTELRCELLVLRH